MCRRNTVRLVRALRVWAALFAAGLVTSGGNVIAAEAASPTPSEVLEKAIYTEETVGNLDAAIKLYQQVIAEGKSARAAAAQAQYRLGLCYLKKNQRQQAVAALEQLIEEFPNEKGLIAAARKHLPGKFELLPAPWGDAEALQFNMKLGTGLDIGTFIYSVAADQYDGRDVWQCRTRSYITANGTNAFSSVICEKENFAPLISRWKHSLLGDVRATYHPDRVVVDDVPAGGSRTIEIDGPVFDNEQCFELFRRLPLTVGYEATIPVVATLGSGNVEIDVEVLGMEKIQVPVGEFECYKLVLKVIGQEFWISADEHRYVARFSAGNFTADLNRIFHRKPTEPMTLEVDRFSLVLPPGWWSYQPEKQRDKHKTTVYLLDPQADGSAELTVGSKDSLPEEEQISLQAWSEKALQKFQTRLKDFKVRTDGLEKSTRAGAPTLSFVADYKDDGKPAVIYGAAFFDGEMAVTYQAHTSPDGLESYRKALDKIIDTIQLK